MSANKSDTPLLGVFKGRVVSALHLFHLLKHTKYFFIFYRKKRKRKSFVYHFLKSTTITIMMITTITHASIVKIIMTVDIATIHSGIEILGYNQFVKTTTNAKNPIVPDKPLTIFTFSSSFSMRWRIYVEI